MPIKLKTETELMQRIASLYYNEKGLGQVEIAKKFGISQVQVSRYLEKAHKVGIVRITVKSPELAKLEQELMERLDLKYVKLVYGDEEKILYHKIGEETARYFEEIVRDDFKIGLSGGRTMVEFVEALHSVPRDVQIYPLTLYGIPTFTESVNPSILLSFLYHKFRPGAQCLRYELPPLKDDRSAKKELEKNIEITRKALKKSDILLTGVGYLDVGNPFLKLCEQKNISVKGLRRKDIVGNIFSHTLNSEGREVDSGVEDYILELLSLDDLKKLAADRNKYIILASGGKKRLPIIKACLKARLFNVLITDHQIGKELLKQKNDREKSVNN